MKIVYLAIIGFIIIFTSCSEELVPVMEVLPESSIVIADDIKLSDITLSKISYLDTDSVVFVNSKGEEVVGIISSVNQNIESVNYSQNCKLENELGNEEVLFQYNMQYIVFYLDFDEIDVNFNIGYKSNYYSCCSGEQYDNMVVTRNNCQGGNRVELLRLLTDTKNLSDDLVECGFKPYDFKLTSVNLIYNCFDKVYKGRVDQDCPVHFYYNLNNGVVSFKDNDGEKWDVKI